MAEVKKKTAVKKVVAKTPVAGKSVAAKKPVSKAAAAKKPVVKEPVEKVVSKKVVKSTKANTLSIDLFDTTGKKSGTLVLPAAIFGAKINKQLMAQALRVYLANQRSGTASTKSRGEVRGSTRKIYRQKGTGRARHGGIRAPIFVGGGIAFGPKAHDFSLSLSKKMRRAALFSALSVRQKEGQIKAVSGLSDLTPKTKVFADMLTKLDLTERKILVIMPDGAASVTRSARNISGISLSPIQGLNMRDVLNAGTVLLMQEAVSGLEKHLLGGEK